MHGIFDNPAAFAPFFDTEAAFYGTRPGQRPVAATVKCRVFEDGFDDPVSGDLSASSTVLAVGFQFHVSCWPDETPPQIGERVECGGRSYFVETVERRLWYFIVTAREGEA